MILPDGGGGEEESMASMMEEIIPGSPEYTRTEFSYDGLGRRVRKVELRHSCGGCDIPTNPPNWVAYDEKRYVWSGNTIAEERDSAGGTVARRFFAEGEQIAGVNYYFTRDHLGSVREMTDSTGAVRARYDYGAFGERSKTSGDLDADFGFTGHYYHTKSNLHLTLYRAYSSTLGRWLSRDPLEDAELSQGPNLYMYVRNNPVNKIDELGLQATNSAEALAKLYGQTGDTITNSTFLAEWGKAFMDCERVPHSQSRRCKCCVISILIRVFGPYIQAKEGRGTVYDRPCSEVSIESITAPPWKAAIYKKPW
jgi:RHS repeat-associated protein